MRISDWSSDVCSSDLIELVRVIRSGGGALTLPATIVGDPQGMQVVSAAIGGRVVSLTRNLGQSVGRGPPIAVIARREAASLIAEIESVQARMALSARNPHCIQRLFNVRVPIDRAMYDAP